MAMKTPKENFNLPPGPWDNEPDQDEWTTDAGYTASIKRQIPGFLCGYVMVDERHPSHSVHYDDMEDINVHGGLTYSGSKCLYSIGRHALQDTFKWAFGFDCGHSTDVTPVEGSMGGILTQLIEGDSHQKCYRNWEYVKKECESLASQLKAKE